MKKLFSLLTLLCFCHIGYVQAANTDISSIQNVIYVTPFSASAGSQVNLSFRMKNTADIRGFQFDLYLPEGVSAVKNSKGRIVGALTSARLDEGDEHTLTLSEQEDGAVRFLCGSQYDECFTGNDGEIATLSIQIAGNVAVGDYPIIMKTVKLTETDISKYYETETVETTLTVTAAVDASVVLDETSATVPTASDGEVDIKVKRTINANEWSTLVLPFDMTEAQLKTALGADVQLAEFTDYEAEYDGEDNVIGIAVNFDEADLSEGFYANYPYLVKTSQKITEFIVTSTITPDEENAVAEYDNGKTGKNRKVYGSLIGTYHAGDAIPANGLFLSENKFWYSVGTTAIKAFRAYFQFNDVLSDMEAASKVRFNIEEATGIKELKNEIVEGLKLGWYTLDGRRLSGKPTAKGTYINKGRKVNVR